MTGVIESLSEKIRITCIDFGLDPYLIAGIVLQESNGDNYAIRHEPAFKYRFKVSQSSKKNGITFSTESMLQGCSIGLMQVMGCVARELGFTENLLRLTDPVTGIKIGCQKLAQLSKKYKKQDEIIASYNAGSPSFNSEGYFINQKYVDEVFEKIAKLKELKIY